MGYMSRLNKSFEGAVRLPLSDCSKYVIISDCHRGTGTTNDNLLKNQNLYFAALQHYYQNGYTYIELGDGDELWENRSLKQIIEAHHDVFRLLYLFHRNQRLYMLYGNHDMQKKSGKYIEKQCEEYRCPEYYSVKQEDSALKEYAGRQQDLDRRECCGCKKGECCPIPRDMKYHSGLILENCGCQKTPDIYLTHGHQADLMNSTLWRVNCFLVRYLWKPLEHFGVLDPTSAAKNYTVKEKTERRLKKWAESTDHVLIAGHTHRPVLSETEKYYYNSGSCVHPYSITCLEIEHLQISLVKWMVSAKPDMSLYVHRSVLAGPVTLNRS
ncbi:MAG: serine/threonine protein phosphatase [Lachnospiraceae bacterium]|nr:serine/threonine protein phosphatase [Lachnospiraceae bacterium]